MSMLQALAIDARSYVDKPLRARVQARIADVIWTQDKEAARALFRRAWEIAEMLECPLSTVKTRLYQGLSVLRRRLERRQAEEASLRRATWESST